MDRERVREIGRKGGRAAHVAGTAHEFTREEARDAGRKGGLATQRARREKAAGAEGEKSSSEPRARAAARVSRCVRAPTRVPEAV